MEKSVLYEKAEAMAELMGKEELLNSLMMAMDNRELQENLEFIDRCHDTNVF
ncbi:hypothetical protein [Liquorilactobacillus hordei]|uniref:Uncharacterized protein n=1 Tax=Liquorilactobacillus hordei DSM 19519 TaxID=1423759 RepID=A0A0R1MSE1_9LACO|nr:hypothetical protein [Liquorilactobacillus hordei]KRL08053.1 hypothetical protein FC92_GL001127 [Liquorilactobacillus hordei DSM 19519]QYH51003.1 hypothetical protein G6O70_00110 [Liquorilactobacillus hordei DSM 19519]